MSALSCDTARRLMAAAVDGELVADERAAFAAHLAGCEACRRAHSDEAAVQDAATAAWPRPSVPPELRARVQALLAAPAPLRWPRWTMAAAAVILAAALGAAAYLQRAPQRPPAVPPPVARHASPGELAALAADTHLRYTRGQLPLEVGSDDPEEVSRWFAGRVPFNLALPDYPVGPGEQKFYHLQGGRLVSFAGDYAAYVAYRMDERPISLIVTTAALARPEGGDTVRFRSLLFHQQAVHGLKVVTWSDKGLTYALASDLSVSGEQSCMVCHGSPEQRRLIEGFARPRS